MKDYIFKIISELDAWAECPAGPYERKEYKIGDYAGAGVGVLIAEESKQLTVMDFHKLLGIILNEGRNSEGLIGEQEVGLLLMVNQIIEGDSLDNFKAQGVVISDGKLTGFKGPIFSLVEHEELSAHYWMPEGSKTAAINLEHIISVMIFSSDLYEIFIDTIGAFIFSTTKDEDLTHHFINELEKIRQKARIYLDRDVH